MGGITKIFVLSSYLQDGGFFFIIVLKGLKVLKKKGEKKCTKKYPQILIS